jgi:hypothetical protein
MSQIATLFANDITRQIEERVEQTLGAVRLRYASDRRAGAHP